MVLAPLLKCSPSSNHLLEPEEKPSERILQLVCKNCRFVKPAENYRVFVHEIKVQEECVVVLFTRLTFVSERKKFLGQLWQQILLWLERLNVNVKSATMENAC